MKQISIKKFIPGIAWFFVVLVLICTPGKEIPKIGWLDELSFDKLVHVGVFGLLAVLFMVPFAFTALSKRERIQYFLRIAISTCIWGITTELIQKYLVPGRSFDLMDWAADSLGALAAFIFCVKKFATPAKA